MAISRYQKQISGPLLDRIRRAKVGESFAPLKMCIPGMPVIMSIRKREWSIEKKQIAYVLENWLLSSISITLDKEHNSMRSLFEPLVSNGYTLQMAPERLGWLEPTDAGLPLAQLRETYRQNGYLWLKGFFDRGVILDFHRFFFETILSGTKTFFEIVSSREYEDFCTMPRLRDFYQEFLEGQPYLHKRKIIRFTQPGEDHCTGGHYDLIYLRAGTDRFCTSWIPLCDTPVEMGGLVYLEHSDAVGRQMEAEFRVKNANLPPEERISAFNRNMRENGWISTNLVEMADRFRSRWLIADYEAGDMVIHSPYMIHAATLNHDPLDRSRLSTDIRYQRVDDPIDPRWAQNWVFGDDL